MSWYEKVDKAANLLSDAYKDMTKEEVELYWITKVNPAYLDLIDAMLKFKHANTPPVVKTGPAKTNKYARHK